MTKIKQKPQTPVRSTHLVRQREYGFRPLTYREWSHMSTCGLTAPDNRPEAEKRAELIREGKLPNTELSDAGGH